MKRSLLIMSTALSCLGLAGCSWMSQDLCSGDDADLSNPACVVQSKQTYRSNESRWFCIGHLEAKDWSCATSLEEAQIKHDAMSDVLAQLGQRPAEMNLASNPIGLIAPASIDAPIARKAFEVVQTRLPTTDIPVEIDSVAKETAIDERASRADGAGLAIEESLNLGVEDAVVRAIEPAPLKRVLSPEVLEIALTEPKPEADLIASSVKESSLEQKNTQESAIVDDLKPTDSISAIAQAALVSAPVVTAATVTATVVLVETLPATAIALAPMVISTLAPSLDAVFTSDLAGTSENSPRKKASQGASLSTDSVNQDRLSSEITQAALESDFAGTTLEVEAEISDVAVALVETVSRPAVVEVIEASITEAVLTVIEVETQEVEYQTEPQEVAITRVDAVASHSLADELKVRVTAFDAPEGLTVAEVAMPTAEIRTEAAEMADTLIEESTRPVVAAVIDMPERVVELPEVLAAIDVGVTMLKVQAEAPELSFALVEAVTSPVAAPVTDAPMSAVELPEVLAAVSVVEVNVVTFEVQIEATEAANALIEEITSPVVAAMSEAPMSVAELRETLATVAVAVAEVRVTTLAIRADALERPPFFAEKSAMASVQAEVQDIAKIVGPKVEKIATEIVVPASEPFPAGTTLAEVYTDHVQRSEQLPAQLQTFGPKGALPMPAVASTSSAQRYTVQSMAVQQNRSANSAFAQAARLAQAAPLIAAVAEATKLDSIAVSATGLDYASMAPPATSGDVTYDYFMDLPSDDFAIQLKAEINLAASRTFASTVDLEDPLVLKTQLIKRPLYVLVLDTFNDIQLASDAKRSWMALYNNGIEPWIRTVGSLQKTMQPIGPMD